MEIIRMQFKRRSTRTESSGEVHMDYNNKWERRPPVKNTTGSRPTFRTALAPGCHPVLPLGQPIHKNKQLPVLRISNHGSA